MYKTSNKLEIEFWSIKTKFYWEIRMVPCWDVHTWSTVSIWVDESKILRKIKCWGIKFWGKAFQDGIYKPSIFCRNKHFWMFSCFASPKCHLFLVSWVLQHRCRYKQMCHSGPWRLGGSFSGFVLKLVCSKPNVTF